MNYGSTSPLHAFQAFLTIYFQVHSQNRRNSFAFDFKEKAKLYQAVISSPLSLLLLPNKFRAAVVLALEP